VKYDLIGLLYTCWQSDVFRLGPFASPFANQEAALRQIPIRTPAIDINQWTCSQGQKEKAFSNTNFGSELHEVM